MKADESRTSPTIVDICDLKTSLPVSHRSRSLVRLLSRATLRSTYNHNHSGIGKQCIRKRKIISEFHEKTAPPTLPSTLARSVLMACA